mmetsp:Transcript_30278/g.78317  ORF Transcript_30278/g.78317 Transcript_30278/m.78317 type:complete len:228 (-) Transcript_30278:290-973(-)
MSLLWESPPCSSHCLLGPGRQLHGADVGQSGGVQQPEHHLLAVPVVPLDAGARLGGGAHLGVGHALVLQDGGRVLVRAARRLRAVRRDAKEADAVAERGEEQHRVRAARHLAPRAKGAEAQALQVAPHHRHRLHLGADDALAERHARVVREALGALAHDLLLRRGEPHLRPRPMPPKVRSRRGHTLCEQGTEDTRPRSVSNQSSCTHGRCSDGMRWSTAFCSAPPSK